MTTVDGFTWHHVTEREIAHETPCGHDGPAWEDCTWCAAIEAWRAAGHPLVPPTLTEAEALRCAAGELPEGGSSQEDVRRGILNRYHAASPAPIGGAVNILQALAPGFVGSVQGNMDAFPAGSHYRRWDPAFAGPHCATVVGIAGAVPYWWCDPLAPEGTGYEGEPMRATDLARYIAALPGAEALVWRLVPDVVYLTHTFHIAAGTRTLYLANLTAEHPPRIKSWTPTPWSGRASSAPCEAERVLEGTSHGSATVAKITRGAAALVGRSVRVGYQWGTAVTTP